jgi:CheY-like chemotaxis protein
MYSFDVWDEQRRSAELREQAHVAQLRALHSQINPHFLFNSLNSVSALILDKDSEKAEEMVTKLARFLRLGLSADPTRKIPLELEIELQRSYLEIEQLRYPDLSVEFDIADDVKSALVPALILQPIVENAVKYGVAGAPPPAKIGIGASCVDGRLRLEVDDSGNGKPVASGGGIGLANVEQRLVLLYGVDRSSMTAGRDAHGGFRVRLLLPLEGRMTPLRVLTVDDEMLALKRLKLLLQTIPKAEHVGEAASCAEAIAKINQLRPEVVLLDIKMRDGNGFEVVEAVAQRPNPPLIIFVTAFDQYAAQAFDSAVTDYLLKRLNASGWSEPC